MQKSDFFGGGVQLNKPKQFSDTQRLRKKTLLVALVAMALAGCGSDMDIVKAGTMEFNKTITIEQAFDNWKSCKKRDWTKFETDSGVKVVQFTCQHSISQLTSKLKSRLNNKADDYLANVSALDIVSLSSIFSFTINQDDTFQIYDVQRRLVWKDGSYERVVKGEHGFVPTRTTAIRELKSVYSNTLIEDYPALFRVCSQSRFWIFESVPAKQLAQSVPVQS